MPEYVHLYQRDEPVTVPPGETVTLVVYGDDGEYVRPIPGLRFYYAWPASLLGRQRQVPGVGLGPGCCHRFLNVRKKKSVTFTPSDYIRTKDMDAFDAYVADLRAVQDYRAELLERYA